MVILRKYWSVVVVLLQKHSHILKVQLVCDHHGCPVWYSGPHIGTTHDTTLYKQHPPPLIDNEQLLGDKGYQGCGSSVIVPFKKRHGEVRIRGDKRAFNIVHRWYRATVEHSIGYLKRFRILNSVYRGQLKRSVKEIYLALNIIIHISAIHLVRHPHRTPYPLFNSDSDGDSDSDDVHDSDEADAELPPISHPVSSDTNPNEQNDDYDTDPNEHKYDYDSDAWDPSAGTGLEAGNFKRGNAVFIWWSGEWWRATITHVNIHTNRVNAKLVAAEQIVTNVLPKHVRFFI
jgi:hypothetical protein